MTFLWAAMVIVVVAAAAIGGLLLVRRRAPEDGFFTDGDRAAGVFGVLATGLMTGPLPCDQNGVRLAPEASGAG